MSKFFSRFSKRKLSFTVVVLLIVAVGTPLMTRQFWVMDADSNTVSTDGGYGFASDVPTDTMKKLKTEISNATTPEIPKADANDPARDPNNITFTGKTLYDQWSSEHLKLTGNQITDNGLLKPNSGKNAFVTALSGAVTQLRATLPTISNDTDKNTLQSNIDRIENTRKTLVDSTSNDSAVTLSSAKTLVDSLSADKPKLVTGALQNTFSDVADRFSAFSSGDTIASADATALTAHNAAADAGSSFSNNLGSKLETAIPALVTSANANAQWGGLPFSRDQYNDFWTKGQTLIEQYSSMGTMTPDLTAKLEQSILDTAKTSLGINTDAVQKFGLTESLAGSCLFDQTTAYNIFLNNAEMAKFKDYTSGLSNYTTPQFSDLTTFTSNSFVVPATGRQLVYDAEYYKADPEGFKRILAQAGYSPDQIEKAAKKFRDKFPVIEAVVNNPTQQPAQNASSTQQPTVVVPTGSEVATTSETSYFDTMINMNFVFNLSDLEKAQAATLTKSINDAINNNLNNSFFGQEYISWLNAQNTKDLVTAYTKANSICNSSTDKKNIDNSALLTSVCKGVSSRLANLQQEVADFPTTYGTDFKGTQGIGTVSMDPRTGDMMYHSAVVCFDKSGKPKIAGEMYFDPVQNQVSGNLSAAFSNNQVTLYSDAITGELYLEYSKLTGSIAQVGSIVTVNTITVAKDGAVGGSFTMFHKLMNYNPNTKAVEVALVKKPNGTLWVSTDGTVRGEFSTHVAGSVSVGLIVDSKGNFTIPVNFGTSSGGGSYGSLYINQDGKISGMVNLGQIIGSKSVPNLFVGFDSSGISSVGFPIGQFMGKPFSFSIGKDGGVSFGGFVPVGPVPVPVALGQDQHGNVTLSWPGGHWTLGHENRPINAPAPKMKADKSGYDGGTIWYHHSFKKGWKLVRVYNVITIQPDEQKLRGDMIFKKYNELLQRNPSITEFLNWYFYNGHGMSDDNIMLSKAADAGQKRTDYLGKCIDMEIKTGWGQDRAPKSAQFPNKDEYKWIQAGNKSTDFAKRPTDLITLNPFDPAVIAKAQAQVNDPSTISSTATTTGASLQQITNAVNTGLQTDTDYKATLQKIYDYFHPSSSNSNSSSDATGFVDGTSNSNTNTTATNTNTNH